MWDKRLLVVLACAVVFGLLAAVMVSKYLSGVQARNHSIVVARVNIPLSTQITAEQLTLLQLPQEAIPEGAFTSMDKLIGRVPVTNLTVREPVTAAKLAPEGADAGLTAMISEGSRAMTVKVDDVVGVAGFVTPGSWVDVVAVITPKEGGLHEGPRSKIVLQHIKVLASNRTLEKQETGEGISGLKAVTLEVTPEQAEKLALAATEGRLQLVMRNSVDKDAVTTTGTDTLRLLTGEGMARPSMPAMPLQTAAAARAGGGASGSGRRSSSASSGATRQSAEAAKEAGVEVRTKLSPRVVEIFENGKRRLIEFP
jgi:pilus assembly protein CpaB